MAVKIFCNACQRFIKNASKVEIRELTGEEICQECQAKVKTAFDEVEKVAKRGIVQVENLRDQIKSELDTLRKKVIKANDD